MRARVNENGEARVGARMCRGRQDNSFFRNERFRKKKKKRENVLPLRVPNRNVEMYL